MPLRVRLVVALIVLVAIGLAGAGLAAAVLMRVYLVGRVDDQLRGVATNSADIVAQGSMQSQGGRPSEPGRRESLPSAYVLEVLMSDGTAAYGPSHDLVDENEPLPRLPRVTAASSRATGLQITEVGAERGDETWRLLIGPITLSDGSQGTVLVAQSLGDVYGTIDKLIGVTVLIGGAVLVVLGALGYLVVHRSLRPLRAVERTAVAIAAGDLSRRVPLTHPRTEVGSVAASLNTMLNEIESAFAARSESEATARASEQRMRRFIGDASHELRTPLTTIRGFAQLSQQTGARTDRDLHTYMDRIESEAERMGVLVEDLLLLARLDQQRPLRQEPVDLLAVVSDVVRDARAVSPARPIVGVVVNMDPPPVVMGDEGRLRQVLGNLMSNAINHTPVGTAIEVSLTTEQVGSDWHARIAVIDEGPGLSPDQVERVFERFYRDDVARTRGGTGLGLSIVAALVAAHHGTVGVVSRQGRGSEFVVTLPLDAVDPGGG